jgi:hypothetical protein
MLFAVESGGCETGPIFPDFIYLAVEAQEVIRIETSHLASLRNRPLVSSRARSNRLLKETPHDK